jgi:hypothetical protein
LAKTGLFHNSDIQPDGTFHPTTRETPTKQPLWLNSAGIIFDVDYLRAYASLLVENRAKCSRVSLAVHPDRIQLVFQRKHFFFLPLRRN